MRISDWSSDVCSSDLPAGDAAGFGGIEDKVDEHWGGLAKAAGLSTLLSFGAELATDSDDDPVRALREGGQTTLNQACQEIVRRKLNVPPSLTMRRSAQRRVGKECISTCKFRWS